MRARLFRDALTAKVANARNDFEPMKPSVCENPGNELEHRGGSQPAPCRAGAHPVAKICDAGEAVDLIDAADIVGTVRE